MDKIAKTKLKKGLLISGIFLLLSLTLISLSFLDFIKDKLLQSTVHSLLQSSNMPNEYKNIKNIQSVKSPSPLSFPSVFEGESENSHKLKLFLLRMTGKYGSYMGLFIYDEIEEKALFVSLAIDNGKKDASYYGINQGIISYWQNKIESLQRKRVF